MIEALGESRFAQQHLDAAAFAYACRQRFMEINGDVNAGRAGVDDR